MDRPEDQATPFVAFVQDDVTVEYVLPETAERMIESSGGMDGSLFELIQQTIVEDDSPSTAIGDNNFNDSLIALSDSDESPGQEGPEEGGNSETTLNRPPDRATNATAEAHPADDVTGKLEAFSELNERPKRAPWKERYEIIVEQFPSVNRLDWEQVFRTDPTIMGNILNDIIKVQVAPKGRPGKRPALDRDEAQGVWDQYQGEDYTLLPFAKAITRLKQKLSVRQFARKVSMSPTYAYHLTTGHKPPTLADMQLVAAAFGKEPSYFYEYRVAFIAALMAERVDYAPESSIIYYERAVKARKDAR